MRPRHKVAVVAYEGLCTFEFGIAIELFGLSRPEFDSWYELRVCASRRGAVSAVGGVRVEVPFGLGILDHAGTILLPGWRRPFEDVPEALLRKLRRAHAEGARLVSVCSGAFVLAATGLLDGKRATTHWRYAAELAQLHPLVTVDPNVLYVEEDGLYSSAGSAAGIDLGLHLIRGDHGSAVANQVARRMVVPPHRDGGQQQFVEAPLGPVATGRSRREVSKEGGVDEGGESGGSGEDVVVRVCERVRARLGAEHTVASMARAARMSPRTFARRFRERTGTTPHRWLTRERVLRAQALLETTDLAMDEIARRSGLGDAQLLRFHVQREIGVAPTTYRRRFRRRAEG